MVNFYKRNVAQTLWHKLLVLGFLFLALALTSLAQGKKEFSSGLKSRRTGDGIKKSVASHSILSPQMQRTGGAIRRPRNAVQSFWDDNTNAWTEGYTHAYTYNEDGYITEDYMKEANGNNFSRMTSLYDSRNNETEILQYYWENNSWFLLWGYKTAYTYAGNRLTETVSQYYENGAWQMEDKVVYTYSTAGNLTEIMSYEWGNNAWVQEEKTTLAYAAGASQPHTATYLEWENNAWVNESRDIEMAWNNNPDFDVNNFRTWQLTNYIEQEWVNNAWVNDERETTTYQANGSFVSVYDEWVNNAWVNAGRYTVTYDAHGNFTLEQDEEWRNSAYVISTGYKSAHTYNNDGDLTQTIRQIWEPVAEGSAVGEYVNSERFVYSNFQTLLAAKEEAQVAAHVYPNPVQDRFSLKLGQNTGGLVKVVSLAGKTMLSTELAKAAGEQEINIGGLPSGTYLLQIHSKDGVRTKKIVKL